MSDHNKFAKPKSKVIPATGTLGFLVGESIQRGAAPSGDKISLFSSSFTERRDLMVGALALLGITHAYNLYTKKTAW